MSQSETSLVSAAWRYRWMVLVVTALVVALALIVDLLRPEVETFEATTSVVLQEPRASVETAQQSNSAQYIRSQLEIMQSPLVTEAAVLILAEQELAVSVDELASAVQILGTPDSPLVLITARANDPEAAIQFANSMANGYREVSQRQTSATAQAQLARVDAQIEAIDERLVVIDEDLTGLNAANADLTVLREQADAAVAEIAEIQTGLRTATADEAVILRLRLEDARQSVTVYQEVLAASSAGPEQQALIQEQGLQIERRARLLTLRDEIEVDAGVGPDSVALVQVATGAELVAGLGTMRILVGAALLGLALGSALAYFISTTRRAFRLRSEPAEVLQAPLMADIPDFGQEGLDSAIPVRDYPRSAAAEAFRFAAASMEVSARDHDVHTVFVVSAMQGTGKTTSVVNTAIAAAFQGRSVLVADCDFGFQEASRLLAGPAHKSLAGITDIVGDAATTHEGIHRIDLGNGASVSLLPRGTRPGVAGTVLQSQRAADLFGEVSLLYDVVFIDGPPLLQVAYASRLARLSDGLIVVVEHQSSYPELAELSNRLELINTPVLGYIYNRSPLRREMTTTEGSMMDILGDAGFDMEMPPVSSKRRG